MFKNVMFHVLIVYILYNQCLQKIDALWCKYRCPILDSDNYGLTHFLLFCCNGAQHCQVPKSHLIHGGAQDALLQPKVLPSTPAPGNQKKIKACSANHFTSVVVSSKFQISNTGRCTQDNSCTPLSKHHTDFNSPVEATYSLFGQQTRNL